MPKSVVKELEQNYKALANGRRLTILKFLKSGRARSVSEISKEIELSFKSTSRHLAVLRSVGLVDREQRDLQAYYSVAHNLHVASAQAISLL